MRRVILLILSLMLISISTAIEIDSKAYITNVVDGDTIDVYAISGFGAGTEYRIRFADINAPELSTIEGQLAKLALQDLLDSKTVYIDVDDITTYDSYNRVVAVVYLPVNSTHVMNVNYYMVLNGYAEIWDFTNNEFDPYTWRLYEPLTALRKVVNINTSEEFSSIQSAISDPETKDGHVIVVYPGIYEENVAINKSIILTSSTKNSSDVVLRSFNSSLPAINITADNVTVSDITIEGDKTYGGLAIAVYGNSTRILNNSLNGYRAIEMHGSGLISGNEIIGNEGVLIRNSGDVVVSYNTIVSSDAVDCYKSLNLSIYGNNISATYSAISFYECEDGYILNNTISGAIDTFRSSNLTVESNTIYAGVRISVANNVLISSNVIFSNSNNYAIYLFSSDNNSINSNFLHDGGLYVEYSYNNYIFNNIINGKPIVYLENARDLRVMNAGQVIAVNSENITIKNVEASHVFTGIELWNTNYSRIENSTVYDSEYGIYLTGDQSRM